MESSRVHPASRIIAECAGSAAVVAVLSTTAAWACLKLEWRRSNVALATEDDLGDRVDQLPRQREPDAAPPRADRWVITFPCGIEYRRSRKTADLAEGVAAAACGDVVAVSRVSEDRNWIQCDVHGSQLWLPVHSAVFQTYTFEMTFAEPVPAESVHAVDGTEGGVATCLSAPVKINRLRSIDCFVLDNSIRETTVAQLAGHTLQCKLKIMALTKECGITDQILAAFGDTERVDDVLLAHLNSMGHDLSRAYAFTEATASSPVDGSTTEHTELGGRTQPAAWDRAVPAGLLRCAQYNCRNPIIEIDVQEQLRKIGLIGVKQLLWWRLLWCFKNLAGGRVFINYRDWPHAWRQSEEAIVELTRWLGTLPAELRPFGLCYEDPTGQLTPFEIEQPTMKMRHAMLKSGWVEGHLLVHIHKNFGLAEATQLEALAAGATGIWCAIPDEGASTGHACSIVTLTNLARLGNVHVQKRFRFPQLYKAAVQITTITTRQPPSARTEIYGPRALDAIWSGPLTADMFATTTSHSITTLLGQRSTPIRVSTMTSASMFEALLEQTFGRYIRAARAEHGPEWHWPAGCGKFLRETLQLQLRDGIKEDYQSPAGLLNLFERARVLMVTVDVPAFVVAAMREAVLADDMVNTNPLFLQLGAAFRQRVFEPDASMPTELFFEEFLSPFTHDRTMAHLVLSQLDGDSDGRVTWADVAACAKWALEQYPGECTSIDSMLCCIYHRYLVPIAASSEHCNEVRQGAATFNLAASLRRSEPEPQAQIASAATNVVVAVGSTLQRLAADPDANVFLLLYAPWCPNCHAALRIWDEVAKEINKCKWPNKPRLVKMNTDKNDRPKRNAIRRTQERC